jgi:hypothetical protein
MGIVRHVVLLIAIVVIPSGLASQSCHYVHPPAPPQAKDFAQPPTDSKSKFVGPIIQQVNVACWHAEPDDPDKCVGGPHGPQKLTVFVPTQTQFKDVPINFSFHQDSLAFFSGGGAKSELKADELPSGVFVSFKGHPIYKIVKIEFPAKSADGPAPIASGVSIQLEFSHEPTNGECYFYVAVWVATNG